MSGTRRARAGTRVYRKLRQPADRVKRVPMTSNEIGIEPRRPRSAKLCGPETAFGCPRDFLDNRFVYVVISPRARGLSVGVNMNPDKGCNFDCAYCEVNRGLPPAVNHLDVDVMATELSDTLALVRSGGLRERPCYRNTPGELLELRHVALSGDGEPTLCADFMEAVQAVMHVRARGQSPFFKIVLLTNASGLDLPAVQYGLKFFTSRDEIWAKLDAGTQAYMDKINRAQVSPEKSLLTFWLPAARRWSVTKAFFRTATANERLPEELNPARER